MAKTKSDPTGQARNRRNGVRALTRRLSIAQKSIKKLVKDSLKYTTKKVGVVINLTQTAYEYETSAAKQEAMAAAVLAAIYLYLLDNEQGEMVAGWYWEPEVELPYRQGTGEETVKLNQILAGAIIAGTFAGSIVPQKVDLNSVIRSAKYQQRLQERFVADFNSIKGLADNTKTQVVTKLLAGIKAGKSPSSLMAELDERFDVSIAAAKRLADTAINTAYTDAKLDTAKESQELIGVRTAVRHISALIPTTRETHAARHGNVYSIDDQREWWDSGANRINCHCSISTVAIDSNNKVIDNES